MVSFLHFSPSLEKWQSTKSLNFAYSRHRRIDASDSPLFDESGNLATTFSSFVPGAVYVASTVDVQPEEERAKVHIASMLRRCRGTRGAKFKRGSSRLGYV